jgi:hypothetical protein
MRSGRAFITYIYIDVCLWYDYAMLGKMLTQIFLLFLIKMRKNNTFSNVSLLKMGAGRTID